jgi:predicted  nucleic acid-binding Zn-ribbon protein
MSSDPGRTEAAIQARRNSTEQMLHRVRDTLRQMRRDHIPVQTAMVARRAEVSRTFLYQNEHARKLLADAAADHPAAAAAASRRQDAGQAGPWKDRALNAEDALKTAYAEISKQRDQIGKLLGRIRDLEIDLPADAVERITIENRTLRQENRQLITDNQQLTERLKAARENNRFLDTRIARLEADLAESLLAGQGASVQPS